MRSKRGEFGLTPTTQTKRKGRKARLARQERARERLLNKQ